MPITYRQLKEFCNQIDEQYLDFPALVFTDELSVAIEGAEIINEETVEYSDGEYDHIICTKKEYDELFKADSEFAELKNTYPSGFPTMWDDSSNMHNSEKFKVIQFESDETK